MGHFCQQNSVCKLWATSANKTPLLPTKLPTKLRATSATANFCQQNSQRNSGPLLPLQTMGHFCQQNSSKKKSRATEAALPTKFIWTTAARSGHQNCTNKWVAQCCFQPRASCDFACDWQKKLNRFLGWQGGINKVRQLKAVKTRPCLVVGGWESKVESESLHPPTHHLRLEIKWPRTDISLA